MEIESIRKTFRRGGITKKGFKATFLATIRNK